MADRDSPPLLWFNHLKTEMEREAFLTTIRSSKAALRRLAELIEAKEGYAARQTFSIESYESPSWACRQAHMNGKREAYDEILGLLKWAV